MLLDTLKAYAELCKAKVVALMLITAVVGMLLADHTDASAQLVIIALIGISLLSCAGGVINHLVDQQIDILMKRTCNRPLLTGSISAKNAAIFALLLISLSLYLLWMYVNSLTAILTFSAFIGYAVVYTGYLKYATPQNIVIGGLSGSLPPLLGWISMTGTLSAEPLLLVLIIYAWTPPHFWSLAICRIDDYSSANIPMLPVTHGILFTKRFILFYSILTIAITQLPFVIGMCGIIYLTTVNLFNLRFLFYAIKMLYTQSNTVCMQAFKYSIVYLLAVFICMIIDHYYLLN